MSELRDRVANIIFGAWAKTREAYEVADEVIAMVDAERDQEREQRFTTRTMTQNEQGQWVPAIPLPFVTTWNKYRCTCRKKPFWTMDEYKQHWVYEHVYLGRPER